MAQSYFEVMGSIERRVERDTIVVCREGDNVSLDILRTPDGRPGASAQLVPSDARSLASVLERQQGALEVVAETGNKVQVGHMGDGDPFVKIKATIPEGFRVLIMDGAGAQALATALMTVALETGTNHP